MQIFDELADQKWSVVISQRHGIACQTSLATSQSGEEIARCLGTNKFIDQRDQGLQILLDGEMEGIPVFEVDGNCGFILDPDLREYEISCGLLLIIAPTCSSVNRCPSSFMPKPPSQPHSTIAND